MSLQSGANKKVRVRFAPSPTGYLHVGGARTAFFNFLYARKHHGQFIVRVEDTDVERSTFASLQMVLEDLTWLGLQWDEGPVVGSTSEIGSHGPYKQSQRLSIYKKIAHEILERGQAYYCFMTDEEIDANREKAMASGQQPHVQSPYEDWTLEQAHAEIAKGRTAVVRFKTKHLKKDYIFNDLNRGEVKFPSDMVGDFVLLRSDGMPVYNFCCAVDDHLMEITHVLRAEEHLSNTLRQLMIYESMGWTPPEFGHVSLVLDEDRQKLSKRKGATSCHQFREEGYLPEALLNYIVLLGWSHPEEKEIMSVDEITSAFSIDRLNLSGAVFDGVKLKWMNAQYLRAKSDTDLWQLIEPFLVKHNVSFLRDSAWQNRAVQVFRPYMETLMDAVELFRLLDDKSFLIHEDSAEFLKIETTPGVLSQWRDLLQKEKSERGVDELTEADFLRLQEEVKKTSGTKGKNLFMPMRVAVIGKPHGTELKILVPLLSIGSLLSRVDQVLSFSQN